MRFANCFSEREGSGLMKTLTTRAPSPCLARTALRKREDPMLEVDQVSTSPRRALRRGRLAICHSGLRVRQRGDRPLPPERDCWRRKQQLQPRQSAAERQLRPSLARGREGGDKSKSGASTESDSRSLSAATLDLVGNLYSRIGCRLGCSALPALAPRRSATGRGTANPASRPGPSLSLSLIAVDSGI